MGRIKVVDKNLRYPTGKKVPVFDKIEAVVEIGRFRIKVLMFMAEMSDECLLGVDFLKMINLENVFNAPSGIQCPKKKEFSIAPVLKTHPKKKFLFP